ncbi:MAG: hypothetical protein A2X86_21250 [Bdellovibrionales bacterium GWA2_49_15]|nr:MAG: hypothetical protein A2X86_21250 [Bdellovibrionales bacterium GWA2_49_15]HAZ14906.1 hypothetical protein [Bdellovibrionales bacterium]
MKILFILLLLQSVVVASEVDNFTSRYEPLPDSVEYLNQKTEEAFDQALLLVNEKKGCSEKNLYKGLRVYFRNHVQGKFNRWLAHTDEISKRPVNNSLSIYQDFKWYEAPTGALKNIYQDTVAEAIVVNGVQLGTDKFEHFFGRGYAYFHKLTRKKKSIEAVLKFGHRSEKYLLGSKTTGIYSYGDLAGNFHGMRFWNHLLAKTQDVLGPEYNQGPYVVCEKGQWQKKMVNNKFPFDWKNYVDASWDEGNNCSAFRTESLLKKVQKRVQLLEEKTGLRHTCPVEPEAISALKEKMFPFSKWFINSDGHKKL